MIVALGDTVRDRINGFEGVVTGRAEYLAGCVRVLVEARALRDGKPIEAQWIDEPRLSVFLIEPRLVLDDTPSLPTGGPLADPPRRADAPR